MSTPDSDADRLTPKPGFSPWLFVVGGVLAFGCMAAAIIMPILSSAGRNLSDGTCQANLRSLAVAAEMYAGENDGRLPIRGWDKSLAKFQPDKIVYACPVQRRIDPRSSGYALSELVAGKELASFEKPEETVLFFDSKVTQPGQVDNPDALPTTGRHRNGKTNNVLYLDGKIKSVSP